jgi:hypothetical protein
MKRRSSWLLCSGLLLLNAFLMATVGVLPQANAQGGSRYFPETGKTVKGKFLDYWNSHGGLAQQGYPISEEFPERSETDNKTYTVQYFERAEFQLHPELPQAQQVQLALLGVFLCHKMFGPNGPPDQTPNTSPGSVLFPQTGKRLGGVFKQYWDTHGGLAQQGYPITNEFRAKSDVDGNTYLMQCFERAVFEYHPEKQPPYNVLLSLLGRSYFHSRFPNGAPGSGSQPTAQPQATGLPSPTPCTGPSTLPLPAGVYEGSANSHYQVDGTYQGSVGGQSYTGHLVAEVSYQANNVHLQVGCDGGVTGTMQVQLTDNSTHTTDRTVVSNCVETASYQLTGRVVQGDTGQPGFSINGKITQGRLACTGTTSSNRDLSGQGTVLTVEGAYSGNTTKGTTWIDERFQGRAFLYNQIVGGSTSPNTTFQLVRR